MYSIFYTEGLDYTFLSTQLTFTSSPSIDCVPVTINNDGIVEYTEYFYLSLSDSDEVEVVIHDPDGMYMKMHTYLYLQITLSIMHIFVTTHVCM